MGTDAFISSRALIISAVKETVLAPGCFSILKITAGLPFNEPSPRLTGPPNFNSATCFNNTGALPLLLITVFAKSSKELALAIFLINTSVPFLSSTKPPVVLILVSCKALSISLMETLYCRIFSGLINTWYCRRSPPMGITWLMPLILINLLRMVKSLSVRMSAAEVVSDVTATIINCPITELMGPMTGTILLGNSTVCNFSAVNCLARYTSVLHSNSTNTRPNPGLATDRTTSTPGAPFNDVSTGRFTCASISSGAIPLASKKMVTRGRFKSGNTSTGKLIRVITP